MPLQGKAAVAMWWSLAQDHRAEFHEWHSKEHLPERLAIPGFCRGSRWERIDGSGGFFVLYELQDYQTLTSPAYLARLNAPTPWSREMMPRHLGMVRSQCRVVMGQGAGLATFMVPLRLSPRPGMEAALDSALAAVFRDLHAREGITGAHLLRTETPHAEPTAEQRIRGGDAVADWIVLLSGHNDMALMAALSGPLALPALIALGASEAEEPPLYRLVHAMTAADL